jgi:hypothetical protein
VARGGGFAAYNGIAGLLLGVYCTWCEDCSAGDGGGHSRDDGALEECQWVACRGFSALTCRSSGLKAIMCGVWAQWMGVRSYLPRFLRWSAEDGAVER